jgi:16S rRNA (guanine527-N7)-methyltransferase
MSNVAMKSSGLAMDFDLALGTDEMLSKVASGSQRKQLLAYLSLIGKWTKVFNLTAVRDPQEMLTHHLLDCVCAISAMNELGLKDMRGKPVANLVDVGSGAGLPGVALAILWPTCTVYCVDSVGKKAAFTNQVRAELSLPNLVGHHGRIEEFTLSKVTNKVNNDFPDLITCRAYASLALFIESTKHLLGASSTLVAMKAKRSLIDDELQEAHGLCTERGLEHRIVPVHVPRIDAERHLVLFHPNQAKDI